MCVALAAIVVAVAGDGGGEPARVAEEAAPAGPPDVPPRPPPRPRPRPQPKDDKGYPRGTKDEFVEVCAERTPLDDGQCGCVYDRLHDEYDYEEFRDLIGRIDPGERRVPGEILEHVLPCRIG